MFDRKKAKLFSILLALSLVFSGIGLSLAGENYGKKIGTVTVSVEDSVPIPEGQDWQEPKGKILNDCEIALYSDDTMMDCIERACAQNGIDIDITNRGTGSGYIRSIDGLEEKKKGAMSGWMGTLNDWFTNKGFENFSVENGKLKSGDKIKLGYTLNLGKDLGSDYENNDKSLRTVEFSKGKLDKNFKSDIYEYTLNIEAENEASLSLRAAAVNKNYQVRSYLNDKELPYLGQFNVKDGDIVEVRCGIKGWPTMSDDSAEGKVYRFKVAISQGGQPGPQEDIETEINLSGGLSGDAGVCSRIELYKEGKKLAETAVEGLENTEIQPFDDDFKVDNVSKWKLKLKEGEYTVHFYTDNTELFKDGLMGKCNIKVDEKSKVFSFFTLQFDAAFGDFNKDVHLYSDELDVNLYDSSGKRLECSDFVLHSEDDNYDFHYKLYVVKYEKNLKLNFAGRPLDKRLVPDLILDASSQKYDGEGFSVSASGFRGYVDKEVFKKNNSSGNLTFSIRLTDMMRTYTVKVPKDLNNFRIYHKDTKAYSPWRELKEGDYGASAITVDKSHSDYDVYSFKAGTIYGLVLTGGGEGTAYIKSLKEVNFSQNKGYDMTFMLSKKGSGGSPYQPTYYIGTLTNDIYTNIRDEGMYRIIASGERVPLNTFRVTQGTGSEVGNLIMEPDKHYKVMYGDSVEVIEGQGKIGREWADIAAKPGKSGPSIVAIRYDESEYLESSENLPPMSEDGIYLPAIDPDRIGIAIYDVDGSGDKIEPNIKQRKYDTIYFAKSIKGPSGKELGGSDTKDFTFRPTSKNGSVKVEYHRPIQSLEDFNNDNFFAEETWEAAEMSEDGSATIKLRNGRNIIRMTSGDSVRYFTLRAKAIDVKTENLTNKGKKFKKGDKVKVSFSDLTLPVYKMAAIYNPGIGNDPPGSHNLVANTRLIGKLNGKDIKGPVTQYAIGYVNYFEFEAGADDMLLSDIHITSGGFGSALDGHCDIDENGLGPNLNAPSMSNGIYCDFPEIRIAMKEDNPSKPQNPQQPGGTSDKKPDGKIKEKGRGQAKGVNTGDDSQIYIYMLIFASGAAMLIASRFVEREKNR